MTQNFAAYGAVDLSSLARPAAPPAGSATANGAGSGAPSTLVIDVTEANFEAEVMVRSQTVPVVIDMWATWCEPCKALSPILERLVAADNGSWVLAKIDVDANQQLAAAFAVQSIPAVFAVIGGRPMALFQGAIPEPDARRVIDEVLQVAAANGVAGRIAVDAPTAEPEAAEAPFDPYAEALAAIRAGDLDGAAAAFREILANAPADAAAKAGLARVELLQRIDGADPIRALAAAAADPTDLAAQRVAADIDIAEGRFAEGFNRLISAIRALPSDEREPVRAHLLGLFEVVGPSEPSVARARTALANALF